MRNRNTLVAWAAFALMASAGAAHAGYAYVSTASGVAVIDLDRMEVTATIDLGGTAARGLAITPDGKYLLTADQTGGDVAVIDTSSRRVTRRVPIGKNPEFMRMGPDGRKAYVTYEPASSGGPPAKNGKEEAGPPAQVAEIDLRTWSASSFLTGGRETEGIEFSPEGDRISVANEGDDTVTSYDTHNGKLVQTVDLHAFGNRPRGIKIAPDAKSYVVTMENSDNLVVLDGNLTPKKAVPVAKGPYGVAFDRSGRRLLVAAARAKTLQVLDAGTLQPIASVPVGERCWHFSFTPDEAYILVACGRSNEVRVIDARSYQPVKSIPGLRLAWGVVTYPKASGSLDVP
ncbi:MAG: beta-propeller fold lactonase family protein [Sphingomonadaceae bacterium]